MIAEFLAGNESNVGDFFCKQSGVCVGQGKGAMVTDFAGCVLSFPAL